MVSASRVRVSPVTVKSLVERRAARKGGRRFEDQAAAILQSHTSRLETHRRSVLLFYLLFGLLAGFFLGIAGAKGVLADTVLPAEAAIEHLVQARPLGAAPADAEIPGLVLAGWGFENVLGHHAQLRTDGVLLHSPPALANKQVIMGLLALIFAVTVSLTGTFWRHLTRSYTPARGLRLEWGHAAV